MKEGVQLQMQDVGCRRGGRWLFRHLNLSLVPGVFIAVVGPSGVGKSSLLECLAGIREPEEGEILYRDRVGRIERPREYQDHLGIVFQNLQILPQETVLRNVLAGSLHRLPWWRTLWGFPQAEEEAAMGILSMLGMEKKAYECAARISGGEQQRVALARAILHEPELYLADEPVANLDAYLTGRVLGYLRQEAKGRGRMVFCVLHHAEHVNRFADYSLSLDPLNPSGWQLRKVRESR